MSKSLHDMQLASATKYSQRFQLLGELCECGEIIVLDAKTGEKKCCWCGKKAPNYNKAGEGR